MMQFGHLGALLFSLAGLGLLDWRHRLAFFADAPRAAAVIVTGVVFFLLWDAAGIASGFFFIGDGPLSAWTIGWELAPELPIEEIFFLILLCYVTLLVWRGATRVLARQYPRNDHRNDPSNDHRGAQ